jgi:NAD+ kinase
MQTITSWAREREIEVLGLPDEVGRAGGSVTAVDPDELSRRADVIVGLGGDGTILRALRLTLEDRTPVLGVNLGRLGFLAEIDIPELSGALTAIVEGRFTIETRSGLRATAGERSAVAFNDVVVVRIPSDGMSAVGLRVEGHTFVRYSADAVVVSTPTGSTAYSFSAGGPIVSPSAEGLLVIPVAPHSAFNRALFLSTGEKLCLEILPTSGELAVEADGRPVGHVHPGDLIDIDVLPGAAQLVRLGGTTFYQRAQRKLRLTGSAEAETE